MKSLAIKEEYELSYSMQDIMRRLKVNIEFSGTGQRSICVTSSVANEGKSTLAFELAKAFAEDQGKRVLFVDADIRNSILSARLSYDPQTPGLTEYLTDKISINETIYATGFKELYLVPCGRKTNNSSQLFKRDAFSSFMKMVRSAFDVIIIDTSPIGMIIDAAIVASLADASLMVVGANMVNRKMIRQSIDTMKKANENFLGVILNKTKEKSDGYGNRYYHYYGKEQTQDE